MPLLLVAALLASSALPVQAAAPNEYPPGPAVTKIAPNLRARLAAAAGRGNAHCDRGADRRRRSAAGGRNRPGRVAPGARHPLPAGPCRAFPEGPPSVFTGSRTLPVRSARSIPSGSSMGSRSSLPRKSSSPWQPAPTWPASSWRRPSPPRRLPPPRQRPGITRGGLAPQGCGRLATAGRGWSSPAWIPASIIPTPSCRPPGGEGPTAGTTPTAITRPRRTCLRSAGQPPAATVRRRWG